MSISDVHLDVLATSAARPRISFDLRQERLGNIAGAFLRFRGRKTQDPAEFAHGAVAAYLRRWFNRSMACSTREASGPSGASDGAIVNFT